MEPESVYTPPDRSSTGSSMASMLSMAGPGPQDATRRRLLLIYIHGFNGSESTFSDMPVHVHSALAALLSESHVVYTRIYPRFKTRGEYQLAVKRFSGWLEPHESHDLDVILLGHSMGGIIAADVALLQKDKTAKAKHRILGIISYDTPYLGLHPHVVSTGIGSLFGKDGGVPEEQVSAYAAEFEPILNDPTFNPPDPPPNYDPKWQNGSERSFVSSVKNYVQKKRAERECAPSHLKRLTAPLKFAGGVNNYAALRRRYQLMQEWDKDEDNPERVRFTNYYTSSTPRQKVKDDKSKKNRLSVSPSIASTNTVNQIGDQALSQTSSVTTSCSGDSSDPSKAAKSRRFCLLPSSHWKYHNNRNWFPVELEDMTELEAHMSMFLPNRPGYDNLVGETVALVEQWIQHDLTQRLLKEQAEAT
ncbi:hypothetical protein N7494_004123 [Penicillium frequentans]|uniref:AB hydrolase-1 domain-containing protein n=1 Tax=Penicillium frequentans TaxID=3151616 RepID=A0AAD6GIL4_9EURO|nr:hypothetical protein N7494_004123 [Penicillium glabrum]